MSIPNGVLSPPQRSDSTSSLASLGKRKRTESEEGVEIPGTFNSKTRTKVDGRTGLLELLNDALVILRR